MFHKIKYYLSLPVPIFEIPKPIHILKTDNPDKFVTHKFAEAYKLQLM